MLTKNIEKLRKEVAAHVAADSIVQGFYWSIEDCKGCFIGCLAHSNDPVVNETTYGLPVMVQKIAESIFEALPFNEAKEFFAALPDAVVCNGKDLTKVGWQFLAAELRALPKQADNIQAAIDLVIAGMDLLAEGKQWLSAYAAACAAADAADAVYAAAAVYAADAAAVYAADADAVYAADWAVACAARARATRAVDAIARAADVAAVYAADAIAVIRRRQRDLLLRLISEAPVIKSTAEVDTTL